MNVTKPLRKISIYKYLTQEFFNCDGDTFKKIANLYFVLYGQNAYNYMLKTYPDWKSGQVGISGKTFNRILKCVPKFLSDEKRFYILKCEVVFFLETTHYQQNMAHRNKTVALNKINDFFKEYEIAINSFNVKNLEWFYGRGIFTEIQLGEFLHVCRYSLQKKLSLAYQQVLNDLDILRDNLNKHRIKGIVGEYTIDFLSSTIDVSAVNSEIIEPVISFKSYDLSLNGTLKSYAEKYILDELMSLDFSEKEGSAKALIKSNDIDLLFGQFNEMRKGNQDISISSCFQGEGGILKLKLEFVPNRKIITQILNSTLIILGSICAFVILAYLGFAKSQWWAAWGSLFLILSLFSKIKTEFKLIKSNNKLLKSNGK